MTRRGFLVLSSSFDPGWSVSVDGRTASTVMVAPAVVGVELGVGTHVVVFRYHGFAHYWWLVALSGVTLAGRVVAFVRGRRESSPAGSERT